MIISPSIITFGDGSTLLNGLISYWKLDEPSGNKADSFGANNLTLNGAVGSIAGKIGNASTFNGNVNNYLSVNSNASLQTGDIQFTFAGWINLQTLGNAILIAKDSNTLGREYTIDYDTSTFRFYINGGAIAIVSVPYSIVNTWVYLICWRGSDGKLNIQLNNSTVFTSASAAIPNIGTGPLMLGRRAFVGSEGPLNGYLDEWGFWKRELTIQEKTDLYNGGNGKSFPF
jgi:hypothetical protein